LKSSWKSTIRTRNLYQKREIDRVKNEAEDCSDPSRDESKSENLHAPVKRKKKKKHREKIKAARPKAFLFAPAQKKRGVTGTGGENQPIERRRLKRNRDQRSKKRKGG